MTRWIAALLAGICLMECGGSPPPLVAARRRQAAALQVTPPLQLARETFPWSGSGPHRNLFAFPDPPKAKPRIVEMVALQPQPVIVAQQPSTPAPAPFPYRYIGSFGPRNAPLAAFARDGEVINVRVGERIDDRCTLRRLDASGADVVCDR